MIVGETASARGKRPINEIGVALDQQVKNRGGSDRKSRHHFTELTVGTSPEGQESSTSLILTGHDDWKGQDLGPLAPVIPAEEDIGKDQDHFNEAEALQVAQRLRDLVDDERNDIRQGDIAALLTDLGREGIQFKDLSTQQSSLEDIFVQLVGEDQ